MSMALDACWSSPADRAGQVDDLLTRIERIETILAQLGLSDVQANQLADISRDAGHLQNLIATSSNAAGGWITDGSFTGVAISTLGWKMSDGNDYPIVQMVDGVLQYGFSKSGTTSTGGTAGTLVGGGIVSSTTISAGFRIYSFSSGNTIVATSGSYLVTLVMQIAYISSASRAEFTYLMRRSDGTTYPAIGFSVPASHPNHDFVFGASHVISMTAGQKVELYGSANSPGGVGSSVQAAWMNVIRV